jgi:hypothetical protein
MSLASTLNLSLYPVLRLELADTIREPQFARHVFGCN